jgi:hypothetical protein
LGLSGGLVVVVGEGVLALVALGNRPVGAASSWLLYRETKERCKKLARGELSASVESRVR